MKFLYQNEYSSSPSSTLSAMEKENRFKLRISRIFRFSFRSCKFRGVSDVIEKAVFVPRKTPPLPSPSPSMPMPSHFPSICRHPSPYPSRTVNESCIISARDAVRRSHTAVMKHKVAEQSPFSRVNARFCPPSSPLTPNPYYSRTDKTTKMLRNAVKTKTKTKKKKPRKNQRRPLLQFSSHETNKTDYDFYGGDWFSSDGEREGDDDDGENDSVFSSRSTAVSSDSSSKYRQRRTRRRSTGCRRRSEKGDSVAVVKRSSDPYGDFQTSMVEMIVERKIFGTVELEKLLQCFLALNSTHHHGTILEVFNDICDHTLFCNLT